LAPTVGIAATGFCYLGGILQLFHRRYQQIFSTSTRSANFSSTRSGNFSSTRSTNFAAADGSGNQIASGHPIYIGEFLQQQQDRRRLVPARFRVYRRFLLFMVTGASLSRKNISRLSSEDAVESGSASV
jgi:hypothetical protein